MANTSQQKQAETATKEMDFPVPNASFDELKDYYDNRIDEMRAQIKGRPEYHDLLEKLDHYKKYPHLNNQEVEVYLSIEKRMQCSNQAAIHIAQTPEKEI